MVREGTDGGVEVCANLHIGIADLALGRLSHAPFLEKILEALGRKQEASDGAWDIALISLCANGDDRALSNGCYGLHGQGTLVKGDAFERIRWEGRVR